MDEAVNQKVQFTQDKWFYLSNAIYLEVISSDWTLVEQDIALPFNIQYYSYQYHWCIPGWITEWYLTREEEYFNETVQSAQEKWWSTHILMECFN